MVPTLAWILRKYKGGGKSERIRGVRKGSPRIVGLWKKDPAGISGIDRDDDLIYLHGQIRSQLVIPDV